MSKEMILPIIVDTTLRDGLQMPGVHLTLDKKLRVLDRLVSIGITEAEIGCPASGPATISALRRMCRHVPSINCSVWCRARTDDIDRAAECDAATIHLSFPTSPRHMHIVGMSSNEILDRIGSLVAYARDRAPFVTVGAQDSLRADTIFLHQFVAAAAAAGAHRVRIADTVGTALPHQVASLVNALHEQCPDIGLEFHGHDDFGLATANTLSAIEAGVEAVSVTVQGVGERAGNAAFEEVVTAAVMLYGYTTSLHLGEIAGLCHTVAQAWGLPGIPHKAISGSNAFRHESGIHCHGMLRDPLAYQPFLPAVVGRQSSYSVGAQSGASSVQAVLGRNGIVVDKKESRGLLDRYQHRCSDAR